MNVQSTSSPQNARKSHASRAPSTRAMTLVEVMCITVVLSIIAIIILPSMARNRRHSTDVKCRNNLKNVGLAYRIWAVDHNDVFPFEVSVKNEGTLELTNDLAAQFRILSNELSTPKILLCPSDYNRRPEATNWMALTPQNVSFFVSLDASETNPASILSGDRGFKLNGQDSKPGLVSLTTTDQILYPKNLHTRRHTVNICMGDGSVTQVGPKGLPDLLAKSNIPTNRIILP